MTTMTLEGVQEVPLHIAASERYLNYALSVITSRALPDVRDGLKPVQRRILYTMYAEMSLHPGGRYRKCAAIVGEVMGKFHPHGDTSIYDALVRMAQDFTLRAPLVDGQGNFGSLDGDPPAAMRYTECKLRPLAEELLSEIKKRTVDFRTNYDGQREEPIVLPAQFPQLLVNGSEGIAVGMATRIPPHNLGEVIEAAIALIHDRTLSINQLLDVVRGPDFPTGGRIIADRSTLEEIYATGQGTIKVQADYLLERDGRRRSLVLTSVPYGQNKARLIEIIGAEVRNKKLPQVVDVRDESTEDVRVVLDLKADASADVVMAYLYRHTPLQTTWPINLTALVPTSNPELQAPERLDLKAILEHWLDFRFETVRRRFEFDLSQLLDRIHVLEGFRTVFDALDEVIAIIRASEGKADAAERLIERFGLTDIQTDAILELKLYRLAKLQILLILEELADKQSEADRIQRLLSSDREIWSVVQSELAELGRLYATPRRTQIGPATKQLEYDDEAYIVKEDTYVIITRDGWIKRQSSFTDLSKIRIRDQDEIGWLFKAHTRSTLTFFTSLGVAYVMRVDGVPSTTGYGEPVQRFFSLSDGERVIGVISHDARHRSFLQAALPVAEDPPPPWALAMSSRGRVLRFALAPHEEPSNKSGRKFARVADGDAIFTVYRLTGGEDNVALCTREGRAMLFPIDEAPLLKAPGRGTTGITLREGDEVMAVELVAGSLAGPTVTTEGGRSFVVRERKFGVSKRGTRGKVVLKRGTIDHWARHPILRLDPDEMQSVAPPPQHPDESE